MKQYYKLGTNNHTVCETRVWDRVQARASIIGVTNQFCTENCSLSPFCTHRGFGRMFRVVQVDWRLGAPPQWGRVFAAQHSGCLATCSENADDIIRMRSFCFEN